MLRSKLFQNGKPEFPIVKDTTLKSTLTLPTKPSMIIFDSKQNRPNLLRDFGRLFDVIFQWIVLYMKKLTIHHYGWVTIPSTVYSVKKCYNRLSWTRCGWMNVQSGYLNQIARLCPFRRFFVVTIGSGTDRTKQKCQNFRGTAISGRCKCSLGGSLRNILLHSPEYGFIIPVGILDILERIRRRLWFWTSCSTPQKRHDLGTGTRHVGRKCCIGGTGGNIVFICPYGGTQSQYAKLPSIL